MAGNYQIHLEIRKKTPYISPSRLKRAVESILAALGWKKGAVGILIVGDAEMKRLNKKYLGHNWPTDVISFSQLEGRKLAVSPKEVPVLGDMIISLDTTVRQAAEYGNHFFYELTFYVCHGILHLMGHDDKTPKDAKRMWNKQTKILRKIGIVNPVKSEKIKVKR